MIDHLEGFSIKTVAASALAFALLIASPQQVTAEDHKHYSGHSCVLNAADDINRHMKSLHCYRKLLKDEKDEEWYNECVDLLETQSLKDARYDLSYVQNMGVKKRLFRCAITKDTGRRISKAWVQIVDNHPTDSVSCTLFSASVVNVPDGQGGLKAPSLILSKDTVSTSNLPDGRMYLLEFKNGVDGSAAFSNYFLECWLPGLYTGRQPSKLYSYAVREE